MNKIIFLQDFFAHQINGGAELHDKIVIDYFDNNGLLFECVNSAAITTDYIKRNVDKVWFISNFAFLKNVHKALISKSCNYLIYEHDYKFIDVRNPIFFDNFEVPSINKININFYKSAKKVICLSKMHREIFEKNLDLDNIENINCSMWSDKDLDLFIGLQDVQKNHKYCIISSSNPIKKTPESIQFCKNKGIEFELISSPDYHKFMKTMAKYKGLVFMTGHPEPTPRVAIEAKMLNCSFVSQKHLIGVAHEDYFHLKGIDMINEVRKMRDEALIKITQWCFDV